MTVTAKNPYSIDACRICGSPPRNGAIGGVCTKCMLVAGMASERDGYPGATAAMDASKKIEKDSKRQFETPSIEELAAEFPRLEVLEIAGMGGMGVVYKARQKELDRIVALKILPAEMASDPSFAARFSQEARALAMLNHTNVVQVYETGQNVKYLYFVMEFVDGINLRQAIREGNLKPEEALSIVPQICEALQFAHNNGIVHRDIKPENILIDKHGVVKVADFGLAKLVDTDLNLTATQQVMGTLHYMAPEQVRQTSDVDHRADLYSLGVVFYEMLTGQLPLGKFALPSDATAVHSSVDSVVLRTLENEPDLRYQTASEIQTDIASVKRAPISRPRKVEPKATLAKRMRDWLWLPGIFFMIESGMNLAWSCYLFRPDWLNDPLTGKVNGNALYNALLMFLAPVLTFVAGWLMLKRRPIQLLRVLVILVFLNSLLSVPFLDRGFWVRMAACFGSYPEGFAADDGLFFQWMLQGLFVDFLCFASVTFATICLVRLFSKTARDLLQVEIADEKRVLLDSVTQLSQQDRRKAKLRLKLPSTTMTLAGVVGLGLVGFVYLAQNLHGYSASIPLVFLSMPFSILAIVAGVSLRLSKGYRFCKSVACVSLIPSGPAYPLFLFAGILTLIALRKGPVQRLMLEEQDRIGRREL